LEVEPQRLQMLVAILRLHLEHKLFLQLQEMAVLVVMVLIPAMEALLLVEL